MVRRSANNPGLDLFGRKNIAPSSILYRSTETHPLLRAKEQPRSSGVQWFLALGMLSVIAILPLSYFTWTHFDKCPPDALTRDFIREEWQREVAEHQLVRKQWEHARSEREQERERWRREVKERDRLEEEERQKLNLFWDQVTSRDCTTFATREYTATLKNLPATWEHRVEACKSTPLEIHGISHMPKSCEDYGPRAVTGRWEINQLEPYCTTFWDGYSDKGCTLPGSGKKRIEHKLMNLPAKADWQEFCATTPIRFDGMQFPGAHHFYQTVFGVYGQWDINDANC